MWADVHPWDEAWPARADALRHLATMLGLRTPDHAEPAWARRLREGAEPECGLMFDAKRLLGLSGYDCTVFKANLFALPPTLDDFLTLPREVMDTLDQVVAAGWRVD